MPAKKCSYHDCGNKVIGEFSVDLDLPKFPFCKKHKTNVSNSLIWTIIGCTPLANAELGIVKETKSKTSFKVTRTSGNKKK